MSTDIFSPPSRNRNANDQHRPLGTDTRLHFAAVACLSVRYPDLECGLCVAACPVGAIAMDAGAPAPRQDCIGCGQCVAACPTAALHVDGFALPAQYPTDTDTVYVDCWRVPLAESPRGAWRVPCLGGINTGWLLALFDLLTTQGERPIRLLDRGGCTTCPAGTGLAAFHAAVEEARTLLSACGVPDAVLPAPTLLPARQALVPAIPTSAGALAMDRRNFFRGLVGSIARTADDIRLRAAPDEAIMLRGDAAPIERLRIANALLHISARHGCDMPAMALPQLSIADCDAHGVCAQVCPTGALWQHDAGDRGELRFHAALCVACGQCVRSCPERALRLSPEGGQTEVETLVGWQARECLNCGESFLGAERDLCPDCLKRSNLQQDMAALFRPSA